MSKLVMRVAISLSTAIALISTAGLAMAKPVKKMAKEKVATEKSLPKGAPKEAMPEKAMATPDNSPIASSPQSEDDDATPAGVAVETKIPPPTMDTNGDGRPDAWDRDSNGVADAWDTNNDDKPDALDNNGDGKPDEEKKNTATSKPETQPR
jgi:hypothetical protein